MDRVTKPLSDKQIKQAKTKDKEYNLTDGAGLMLRIKPNGSKLWLFNYYRPFTKKRANMDLGKYPEVTLAEVRQLREKTKNLLAKDIDPQAHKIQQTQEQQTQEQQEAIENTFGKLAEKWYALKKQQLKADTADKAWQTMSLHVLPLLGLVPIHLVKPKLVIDILTPVASKGSLKTVK